MSEEQIFCSFSEFNANKNTSVVFFHSLNQSNFTVSLIVFTCWHFKDLPNVIFFLLICLILAVKSKRMTSRPERRVTSVTMTQVSGDFRLAQPESIETV